MTQITTTITADCTLVSHLLDTCESLVAACRELQKASRPAPTTFTVADHPVESVDQMMLTQADQDDDTALPEPISAHRSIVARAAAAAEKFRDVDVLIDHVLETPDEWHSSVLDDWMRTETGYHQVVSRLHRVAKNRGTKISVVRRLDEDDPGNSVHVHLRQGGDL